MKQPSSNHYCSRVLPTKEILPCQIAKGGEEQICETQGKPVEVPNRCRTSMLLQHVATVVEDVWTVWTKGMFESHVLKLHTSWSALVEGNWLDDALARGEVGSENHVDRYQNFGITHFFIVISISVIIVSVVSCNRASTSTSASESAKWHKMTVIMVIITITTAILESTSSLPASSTQSIYTSIGIKILQQKHSFDHLTFSTWLMAVWHVVRVVPASQSPPKIIPKRDNVLDTADSHHPVRPIAASAKSCHRCKLRRWIKAERFTVYLRSLVYTLSPWKMVVGRLLSYLEGNFSGAMLNFGKVIYKYVSMIKISCVASAMLTTSITHPSA